MSFRDKALLTCADEASGSASSALTTSNKKTATLKGSSAVGGSNPSRQTKKLPSTSVERRERAQPLVQSAKVNETMTAKSSRARTSVIDSDQHQQRRRRNAKTSGPDRTSRLMGGNMIDRKASSNATLSREQKDESSSSSQEMIMTSCAKSSPISSRPSDIDTASSVNCNVVQEQETNIDRSVSDPETDDEDCTTLLEPTPISSNQARQSTSCPVPKSDELASSTEGKLPSGWQRNVDKSGVYYWHIPTGAIQRNRPTGADTTKQLCKDSIVLYHDDEEINQSSPIVVGRRTSSDDEEFLESGAALTMADETTLIDSVTFIVHPLGCCEFDETQLISANSTRAIQKCILSLLNKPNNEESACWGLDQSQSILMRILEDHIQFTDVISESLLRSQPIGAIKTWAVDDDNNFAFVVEDHLQVEHLSSHDQPLDYALLNGPTFVCYVFRSMEDDDMSVKVAAILNEKIGRYRHQQKTRETSKRSPQMIDSKSLRPIIAKSGLSVDNDQTDADEDFDDDEEESLTGVQGCSRQHADNNDVDYDDDDDNELSESNEITLNVKYIGSVQVPRPMGIEVLNAAIDKCLADASKAQMDRLLRNNLAETTPTIATENAEASFEGKQLEIGSPLIGVKIHVSSSNVIVESEQSGEIIVECRIRYLTFMGISRRDIRWCGFIMQNTMNKTFVAYCFECLPTAGHVCKAIQMSCARMYEKMIRGKRRTREVDRATSIIPKSSTIRDTLSKTLSRIKLTPII